jgi:hypothetical protein
MVRRYAWLLLLALFLAPLAARADEVAQPVPTDGACAVPADEHWTRAEKFVWERVCAGRSANFNAETGYGGDLDPKKPEGLPESRVLTSAFLETILLKDKYRRVLTRRGVRIIGARFTESVDLENAQLGHELWLQRCLLEKGADFNGLSSTRDIVLDGSKVADTLDLGGFSGDRDVYMSSAAEFAKVTLVRARIGGTLDLAGAKVTDKLDMDGIQIGQNLFMRGGAQFAEVVLRGGHVGGQLSMIGSKFAGDLNMGQLRVDQSLYMRGGAQFAKVELIDAHIGSTLDLSGATATGLLDLEGLTVDADLSMGDKSTFTDIDLKGAHIGATLDFGGAKVTGKLDLNRLRVDQSLYLREGAEFATADLTSARVGGQIDLGGSKFTGKLDMGGMQVEKSLYMRENARFAEISLRSSRIGGQLSLSSAKVTGALDMDGVQVGQDLYMGDGAEFAKVDLTGARIHGALVLSGSKVGDKLDMDRLTVEETVFLGRDAEFSGPIDLLFGRIGSLELAGGVFRKDVDLTGTQIEGELRVGAAMYKPTRWPDNPILILRNAKADAIQDLSSSWPARLDLAGFTYRNLGGLGAGDSDAMADRSAKWFEEWLARSAHYSPQTYEQLAAVLRSQGQQETAENILYAGREQERHESSGLRAAWLFVLKIVIGYGYYVWRSVAWTIVLLAIGAAVQATRPGAAQHGVHRLVLYSFEMLLPVIRLRGQTRDFPAGWQDFYFHFHGIMGFVLAAFMAAGLSGLTK